ncbi:MULTISPECIES: acyltransferase [unclassified Pseudomonas]|uniref:acyltransferase family protein n=1 Tax=unclassified Pseudomonas TaxID=196821 RepID=UPI000EA98391|nr:MULTISPECIES: acyltransferase [unclassified Pseudomonas]AYF89602.1 acyltransferase [Pseudomonas sp. DY-1]MDH4656149.1 acyltransferase [Pseudomonas sp. BN606]MRK21242.1 acyltransferase [Pseudomonas sp. JG-B]
MITSNGSSPTHRNCFDLVRHFAAFMVLFSHHFALSGMTEPSFLGMHSLGGLAVVIFFSISGYLVTKSFVRSANFYDYLEKRARRIFPGLIACSAVVVFVVIPFYVELGYFDYLSEERTWKTFLSASMLLGIRYAGIFSDFIYSGTINGSLWTLPIEFLCYLIVGVVLVFSRTVKAPLALLVVSFVGMLVVRENSINYTFYAISLERLMMFLMVFSLGGVLALTESIWMAKTSRIYLIVASMAVLFVFKGRPEMMVLGNMAICVIVIAFCTSFSESLIAGRFDVSYGVYIYAFPVQQLVINNFSYGLYSEMALSALFTLVLAIASWLLVEKPMLKRGKG